MFKCSLFSQSSDSPPRSGRIRVDLGSPRSLTFRVPKKSREPRRRRRNTPESCEDRETISPVALLRIVRAVVIWETHSTLMLICQGQSIPLVDRAGKIKSRRRICKLCYFQITCQPQSSCGHSEGSSHASDGRPGVTASSPLRGG